MDVVNGFQCRNCTDIDYAKRHIDPAHPKDGPYGVNAKTNPERAGEPDAAETARPLSRPERGVGVNLDLSV